MDLSKASSLLVSFLFIGSLGPRGPQFLELHLPPLPPSSVIPSFSASLLLLSLILPVEGPLPGCSEWGLRRSLAGAAMWLGAGDSVQG